MEDLIELVRANIRRMTGYVPGWQPGPGEKFVKLNTNENPYPPSPRVLEAIRNELTDGIRLYPNPDSRALRVKAGEIYGVSPDRVICGNGSDEILAMIMRTMVQENDPVAYFDPSYSLYPVLADIAAAGKIAVELPRDISRLKPPDVKAKVFFLSTPNAPYGFSFPNSWIADFLANFKGIVVADEAYVDFAEKSAMSLLEEFPTLIVVRTLSKSYSLAGLRVGLAISSRKIIDQIHKVRDSYNLNRLSQTAAVAALGDQDYFRKQIARVVASRESFSAGLRELNFTVLPSQSNFIFAIPPDDFSAAGLNKYLFSRGILVRYFDSPRLSDGVRISIGTDEQMGIVLQAIKEYLKDPKQE